MINRKYSQDLPKVSTIPTCDDVCSYCLSSTFWKCVQVTPICGWPEFEVTYFYECQFVEDGEQCGGHTEITTTLRGDT